mgnify:CR=1 FL=1
MDSGTKEPVAVAIRKDGEALPRVVATGRGSVAEEILAIAYEQGVKVREDANLAQLLVALELDAPIPVEAFAAVAEILHYLQQAQAFWPDDPGSGMIRETDSTAGAA